LLAALLILPAVIGAQLVGGALPASMPQAPTDQSGTTPHYIGSQACGVCHVEIYARWKKTPMANVVRDPQEHPDAILPDLSKPDPLVHFKRDQIALVYGSVWKQRYFTKIGDDYYVFPAQWDVTHRVWRATLWKTERAGGPNSTCLTT